MGTVFSRSVRMKVVILCGGQGTRLREVTEVKPKPMVEIGHMPILLHIMKTYSHYGFHDFVLCLGYKGEDIKEYFYNYDILANDFTIELNSKKVTIYPKQSEMSWKVTLVDTGLSAMTGARVKRIEKFITEENVMLTYGDGVTDLNIQNLLKFHKAHGKIGTVTGVSPPSRYGELNIYRDEVLSFKEKPVLNDSSISGGYFVFKKDFFNYLDGEDGCVLEHEPLERLAKEGQLKVYRYNGFWQCMDTLRDLRFLTELWDKGNPPWKIWD